MLTPPWMHSVSFTLNIGCVHADEPFDRHLTVIRVHYEHLKLHETIEHVKILNHGLSTDKLDV